MFAMNNWHVIRLEVSPHLNRSAAGSKFNQREDRRVSWSLSPSVLHPNLLDKRDGPIIWNNREHADGGARQFYDTFLTLRETVAQKPFVNLLNLLSKYIGIY